MAHHHIAIGIAQMETVSLAVAEHVTVRANATLHPLAVAINIEAVVPHIPEAVVIDVALLIIASYTKAS